jgi:ribosome biogenesis GTPase
LAILEEWKSIYPSLGYPLFAASVETGEGLDVIDDLLQGKVTLLAGHSGVGKSSLINHLAPGLGIKVNSISEKFNKGKHTTTFATMHQLEEDTYIIDTPGIKEFGLSQVEPDELSGYFQEMKAILTSCRYNNCLHRDEPGCAVKEAVADGAIAESRYVNYLQILDSLEEVNHWERD